LRSGAEVQLGKAFGWRETAGTTVNHRLQMSLKWNSPSGVADPALRHSRNWTEAGHYVGCWSGPGRGGPELEQLPANLVQTIMVGRGLKVLGQTIIAPFREGNDIVVSIECPGTSDFSNVAGFSCWSQER
jgi:hypothetical protein